MVSFFAIFGYILFTFSTIISWGDYGERTWAYLFGERTLRVFQVLFAIGVFVGSVVNLQSVLNFCDMMLLSMAFSNLLACFLLAGKVAAALENYMHRLQANKMPVYR